MGVGTDNILGVADHEYMILAVNPKNNTDRTLEGRDRPRTGSVHRTAAVLQHHFAVEDGFMTQSNPSDL
jgi:hypothetical protein